MDAVLESQRRDDRGKNAARRLRRSGRIPAVVYGSSGSDDAQGLTVSVDPRALMKILRSESGANTLITLKLPDGGETRVLVKEYQLDPVSHRLLHADFYRIRMDRAIVVSVPIVLRGEARGVKQQGGLVDFTTREIEVECLPGDIPEHIDVDVSDLLIGQGLRVRDLPPNPKWTPVSDPDTMIVHVYAPRAEEAAPEEAAAAAAPAPAEPEVIKKGKKEEEEEEQT